MKTFAHYDSTGAIQSLVAFDAPEGAGLMLEPEPGVFVDEVEGVEVKSAADVEAMRAIVESHKLEPPDSRPRRLVRK